MTANEIEIEESRTRLRRVLSREFAHLVELAGRGRAALTLVDTACSIADGRALASCSMTAITITRAETDALRKLPCCALTAWVAINIAAAGAREVEYGSPQLARDWGLKLRTAATGLTSLCDIGMLTIITRASRSHRTVFRIEGGR